MIPILLLSAFFTPYLLWPVELFLPYPYIVEEIAKAILVLILLRIEDDRKTQIYVALGIGACFAFTESVFYIFNISLVGSIYTYFLRLLLTIPLHSITTLIIFLVTTMNQDKKRYLVTGVFIAGVIHFLFNFVVLRLTHLPS
jgi:RsiW-degrading membrane proteinase PrsW (M82 family)